MHATQARAVREPAPIEGRLAGAPISWGACEVPGWGLMPSPDSVLAEMAELGMRGTELGAPGFLPDDPSMLSSVLERHGLELVGGFVPLVLHEERLDQAKGEIERAARLMGQSGGPISETGGPMSEAGGPMSHAGSRMLVVAAVQDINWSVPQELAERGWARLAQHLNEIAALAAEHGMTVALHPHAGTLIETQEQVARALEMVDVGWCLDTGHLLIGGTDPVEFARAHGDRVVHVHLKDVDAALAAELRAGRRSLLSATRDGLFLPLGKGDARIGEVMDALQSHGYDGWLVLEQDTAITGDEPTVAGGPMRDARESIAFLHDTARRMEEIDR